MDLTHWKHGGRRTASTPIGSTPWGSRVLQAFKCVTAENRKKGERLVRCKHIVPGDLEDYDEHAGFTFGVQVEGGKDKSWEDRRIRSVKVDIQPLDPVRVNALVNLIAGDDSLYDAVYKMDQGALEHLLDREEADALVPIEWQSL